MKPNNNRDCSTINYSFFKQVTFSYIMIPRNCTRTDKRNDTTAFRTPYNRRMPPKTTAFKYKPKTQTRHNAI